MLTQLADSLRAQVATRHFQGALSRWPKDALRPDCQLQDVLARRLQQPGGRLAPAAAAATRGAGTPEQADLKQANALYSLLEDRYKNKVRVRVCVSVSLSVSPVSRVASNWELCHRVTD